MISIVVSCQIYLLKQSVIFLSFPSVLYTLARLLNVAGFWESIHDAFRRCFKAASFRPKGLTTQFNYLEITLYRYGNTIFIRFINWRDWLRYPCLVIILTSGFVEETDVVVDIVAIWGDLHRHSIVGFGQGQVPLLMIQGSQAEVRTRAVVCFAIRCRLLQHQQSLVGLTQGTGRSNLIY